MIREERIGRARLLLGDCRDLLPTLEPVDLVCTDPPYGIGENANRVASRTKLAKTTDYGDFDWDQSPPPRELIDSAVAAGKHAIIWGGNYFHLPPARGWLVWDKVNSGNFADCELAWTNLKMSVRQIRYMWNGMLRERGSQRGDHPTQKPLEVMKWCIGFLPDVQTILDPFMGSGTTGVAAIQMGKDFIGIEREERYFEAACRRIREANGDDAGPLFAEAAA